MPKQIIEVSGLYGGRGEPLERATVVFERGPQGLSLAETGERVELGPHEPLSGWGSLDGAALAAELACGRFVAPVWAWGEPKTVYVLNYSGRLEGVEKMVGPQSKMEVQRELEARGYEVHKVGEIGYRNQPEPTAYEALGIKS